MQIFHFKDSVGIKIKGCEHDIFFDGWEKLFDRRIANFLLYELMFDKSVVWIKKGTSITGILLSLGR